MLKYCETTTLILAWCFALSLGWAVSAYLITSRGDPVRSARVRHGLGTGFVLPALVAAPLALVVAFRAAGVNLLYPVHFFADLPELIRSALAPAGVLLLSSGLAGSLARQIPREYAHWEGKTFILMAKSIGQRPGAALRRLVLLKSLVGAWSQCLPWLFGELVIVESVFNAPGLGLDAWHLARERDLTGLAGTVGWLAGLYVFCVLGTAMVSRRLGRRLESYA